MRRRPPRARPKVTSSAYSRSPPTGSPLASRVTATPSGDSKRSRYIAVASPSVLGLVATMTSVPLLVTLGRPVDPGEQLLDSKVLGADPLDRADRALQYVIEAADTRAFSPLR